MDYNFVCLYGQECKEGMKRYKEAGTSTTNMEVSGSTQTATTIP